MAEIVRINLETADLTQWDSTSGGPTVTTTAALANTNFGQQAVLTGGTTSIFGTKSFTVFGATPQDARFRFYFDPNGLTMAGSDLFGIIQFVQLAPFNQISQVLFNFDGSSYEFWMDSFDDGGFNARTVFEVTDAEHWVEAHIEKATSDVAADGRFRFWVDGTLRGTHSNVDIYDRFELTDAIRGGVFDPDAGTSGTCYLDEIVVRNDAAEIGAHIGGVEPAHLGRGGFKARG